MNLENSLRKHYRAKSETLVTCHTNIVPVIAQAAEKPEPGKMSPDEIMDVFVNGINKWNGILKNALVGEFMTARKNLLEFQSLQDMKERNMLLTKIIEMENKIALQDLQVSLLQKKLECKTDLIEESVNYLCVQRQISLKALLYARWKAKYVNSKRHQIVNHIAEIHYITNLKRKTLLGWNSAAGILWKVSAERKIRISAEKFIKEMSFEYEEKIKQMSKTIEELNVRIIESERAKEAQQEEMKRGLMRGVCALNMEALAVFRDTNLKSMHEAETLEIMKKSDELERVPEVHNDKNQTKGSKSVSFMDVKKRSLLTEEQDVKVYFGNLAFSVEEPALEAFASTAGKVVLAEIIKFGKRSKGFGFVTYATKEFATAAINTLNEKELEGRPVLVKISRPKVEGTKKPEENKKPKAAKPAKRVDESSVETAIQAPANGEAKAASVRTKKPRENKPKAENAERQSTRIDTSLNTSLYVANLPYKVKDEDLFEIFKEFQVKNAYIVKRFGRSKGFGFVELHTTADRDRVLDEVTNAVVNEREIIIKPATAKPVEE